VVSFTPDHFTPEEQTPGAQWIGDWVDPISDLNRTPAVKFVPWLMITCIFIVSNFKGQRLS
jgi:disulfide bond formation protein DsbB